MTRRGPLTSMNRSSFPKVRLSAMRRQLAYTKGTVDRSMFLPQNYTDCGCVESKSPGAGFAEPGRCANASCWTVWIVVVLFFLLMLFHFSSDTVSDFIILRLVK